MRYQNHRQTSSWTILGDAIGLASICLIVVVALSLTGMS